MTRPCYESTRSGVVVPVGIDPSGGRGPTPAQARGPRWRRSSHGFYVRAEVDASMPEQRIVEASVVIPEVGGLTGWAALRWLGAEWFDGTTSGGRELRPVTIATCYEDVRSQSGILVRQERLTPTELFVHDGVPLTEPARSVCHDARYAPTITDAVITFDMAAFADLLSLEEYAAYALARRGWTGVPQAREVIALADENSWSPMETRLRVEWCLGAGARLPRPLTNAPLFDLDGHHIGTPDLFDPALGLAMEYDSTLHLTTARRSADLDREIRFRDHGIDVMSFLPSDAARPGGLATKLAHAIRRAEDSYATRPVRWTLDQPVWWRPSETVAQRRALAAQGLTRLLPSHRYAA